MRIGLNSFLYASPFTTESTKLFGKFKKWGFDTVEIPIEDPSHIDPVKVKAAAAKAGIAIGSICACMGPGRDFRGSPEDQKAGMDYCTALIDQAAAMGCPALDRPGLLRGRQGRRRRAGPAKDRMGARRGRI